MTVERAGRRRRGIGIAALAALALFAACGGGAPTPQEAAPFRQAVEAYLAKETLGMRPDAFVSLAIDGDKATAEVSMAVKDVSYGLRPRWTYAFARKGGRWEVVDVRR